MRNWLTRVNNSSSCANSTPEKTTRPMAPLDTSYHATGCKNTKSLSAMMNSKIICHPKSTNSHNPVRSQTRISWRQTHKLTWLEPVLIKTKCGNPSTLIVTSKSLQERTENSLLSTRSFGSFCTRNMATILKWDAIGTKASGSISQQWRSPWKKCLLSSFSLIRSNRTLVSLLTLFPSNLSKLERPQLIVTWGNGFVTVSQKSNKLL